MNNSSVVDLVCLVADNNIKQALLGLLGRHRALGIRPVTSDIPVHPEHDPGCRLHSPDFLRPYLNRADYAMVILDHEGSGRKDVPREELEEDLEERLEKAGWRDRAAVVVIGPELEAWVWSTSPHVEAVLGWSGRSPDLRTWLQTKDFLGPEDSKPERPKEAMEEALFTVRKPRSASVYRRLAEKVSVVKCVDPSFAKFKTRLQLWFPAE